MLGPNALTTYATAKAELGLADDSQRALVERRIQAASAAVEGYCNRAFCYAAGLVENVVPGDFALTVHRLPILAVAQVKLGDTIEEPDNYYSTDEDKAAGIIRNDSGWTRFFRGYAGPSGDVLADSEKAYAEVTYTGGYVPDADVWLASSGVRAGAFVKATAAGATDVFQAQGFGSTGLSEPVWPAALGDTVVDGGVTWKNVGPRTLPFDLEEAVLETVTSLWRAKGKDQRITGVTVGSATVQYSGRNPSIGREGHIIPDGALIVLQDYALVLMVT